MCRNRVLPTPITQQSILALNAILVEAPESLTTTFNDETLDIICQGLKTPVSTHPSLRSTHPTPPPASSHQRKRHPRRRQVPPLPLHRPHLRLHPHALRS